MNLHIHHVFSNVDGVSAQAIPFDKLRAFGIGAIVTGQPYDEAKAFHLTSASAARRLKHLQNQALALNMKLVPA